jgi:hypothetical protein
MSLRPIAWALGLSSFVFAGCVGTVVTDGEGGGNGTSSSSSGSTGTGGQPEECGGLIGKQCGANEYCEYIDMSCGGADQPGVCKPIPEMCPLTQPPTYGVCGCDGNTYPDECFAHAAGTSVAHQGSCEGNVCGGFGGDNGDAACGPGEFCEYPDAAICGAADAPGKCAPIPPGCTDNYDPVCGCDEVTYSNRCEAYAKQVSVVHEGACTSSNQLCGGFTPGECPSGEFCNYEPGDGCGATDQAGHCMLTPLGCPGVDEPVCGCDGQAYANECEAHAVGIGIYGSGPCVFEG